MPEDGTRRRGTLVPRCFGDSPEGVFGEEIIWGGA